MTEKKAAPVLGDIQTADEAGFAKLIVRAGKAYEQGLQLVGVVNIGKDKIGGVFVRIPRGPVEIPGSPLLGE